MVQKSVAFFYIINENPEREIRESIPLTQHPNHRKPGNKPNQRGKGFVLEILENTHERNARNPKTENHCILMDQKNKHC